MTMTTEEYIRELKKEIISLELKQDLTRSEKAHKKSLERRVKALSKLSKYRKAVNDPAEME